MPRTHQLPPFSILGCAVLFAAAAPAQHVLATRAGTLTNGQLGTVVRAVGDQNGDGVADFVASEPGQSSAFGGRAYLVSGATRSTLATFLGQTTGGAWGLGGNDVCPLGDVDGDGRGDFAIGYSGVAALDVFSGATGARFYRLGPAIEYRASACGVGDYDGDGRADFAGLVYLGGQLQLWLVRGTNGAQLTTVVTAANDGLLRDVGDQNGDGFREIAVITPSTCDVYNLHPPALLRRVNLPATGANSNFDLVDWNGDGRLDLVTRYEVVGAPSLFVHSLATGAQLRSLSLPAPLQTNQPHGMAVLGDLDGDGTPDLAVRVDTDSLFANPAGYYGHVAILSGRTGQRLGDWPGSAQIPLGSHLSGLGDVDADGFPDFVVEAGVLAAPNGAGGWQVISGRTFAAMLVKPSTCYAGPFPPTLGTTRPVLGGVVTLAGRDAPLGCPGFLVLSNLPAWPTNLGYPGCDAWYDPPTGAVLAPLATAPDWQLSVPLPALRLFVGTEIALQAMYFGTNTPLGLDLTNGLWARVGY